MVTDIAERVAEILRREGEAILSVRVTGEFERAVRAISQREDKVIATGMGKAGHVARRFAATLCSTGTVAIFIHPGDAAHGDLGAIAPADCLIAFSTSGKTREVLETIGLARQLGVGLVIGITSHADSALRDLSDLVLDMGPVVEPCRLGLMPTASTAVMSAIGNAIALVLMELSGFTRQDFGQRHHGGYLGHQIRQHDARESV